MHPWRCRRTQERISDSRSKGNLPSISMSANASCVSCDRDSQYLVLVCSSISSKRRPAASGAEATTIVTMEVHNSKDGIGVEAGSLNRFLLRSSSGIDSLRSSNAVGRKSLAMAIRSKHRIGHKRSAMGAFAASFSLSALPITVDTKMWSPETEHVAAAESIKDARAGSYFIFLPSNPSSVFDIGRPPFTRQPTVISASCVMVDSAILDAVPISSGTIPSSRPSRLALPSARTVLSTDLRRSRSPSTSPSKSNPMLAAQKYSLR
mmetsp:Transcript_4386/g.6254  ORF Transcript_4386/g.6254 Transcript_4386/m.6254 type:complete len:264 (+) Transcript_4386:1437-2228(+)